MLVGRYNEPLKMDKTANLFIIIVAKLVINLHNGFVHRCSNIVFLLGKLP
jgi:hypothetical protein